MEFKWYVTVDIDFESQINEDYEDISFQEAFYNFQMAQNNFFEYLDSKGVIYKVINDESK